MKRLFLCIIACFASLVQPRAAQMVVPPQAATAFGNASEGLFYGQAPAMYAYDGSLFSSTDNELLNLQGFSLRFDEKEGLAPAEARYGSIQIWLSTMNRPISTFTTAPEANRGTDRTLVYSGTDVRLSANRTTDPTVFQFEFPFQTFFQYNRFSGPLIVEVDMSNVTGTRPSVDSTISPFFRRIQFGATWTVESEAPVLEVQYTIVPEPSALCLTTIPLLFLLFKRKENYGR